MTNPTASERAIATASAVQVRQGISKPRMPKWKPYEPYLQPLMEGLHGI